MGILLVTVVTLLKDLCVAVACGVAVACFMYVYDSATMIGATTHVQQDAEGTGRSPQNAPRSVPGQGAWAAPLSAVCKRCRFVCECRTVMRRTVSRTLEDL